MILPNPTVEEVLYIGRNMREKSREDIFGAMEVTLEDFCVGVHATHPHAWVAYHDGLPAAYMGAKEIHKGLWSLAGFGTDDWVKVWKDLTRTGRRELVPILIENGARRAHCISPSDHHDTHRWLRMLGATEELRMRNYGLDGRDYTMLAWLRD